MYRSDEVSTRLHQPVAGWHILPRRYDRLFAAGSDRLSDILRPVHR